MKDAFITPPGHEKFSAKQLFQGGGSIQWAALAYIEPGGGGPAGGHVHESGHIFIVTEGRVRVMLGDQANTVEKDESFVVPGGVLHSIWNDGPETAKVIKLNVME